MLYCMSSLPQARLAPSVGEDIGKGSLLPSCPWICWAAGSASERPAQPCSVLSIGNIWCLILQGQLEEAAYQLEFLKAVQQSLGKSEVLFFLQALVASKKQNGEQEATELLKEAVELHFSSMQGLPLGPEYFEKLDPLFLVCIAKEYLHFCPKQ
ncbi:tetratricopeptide repeat protein 21A-like, partial [Nannospalax galili]|uniref:tetratricopeptide repeat protein 21A-like n=1 Tax=Nannospalax galili TaxID=1026970 RepID=UPI00111C0ECC